MQLLCRIKTFIIFLFILFSWPAQSISLNWRQAFEQHHIVMLFIRPGDGQIVKANQAASKFYGYPVAKLESMTIQQINTFSPQAVLDEMALARQEHRNYFIFAHRLANGDIKTVEVSSIPIVYDDEQVLYSIIRDISEFREAQDGLWHYQNRLEEMVAEQSAQLTVKHHHQIIILSGISVVLTALLVALGRQMWLQRKTRSLLQMEKNRLSDVIWGANVGTWEWHIDSDSLVVSDFALKLIGYEKWPYIKLTRARVKRLCNQDDWNKASPSIIANMKGQSQFYESEVRVRHKNGHWIWVLSRGRVIERDSDTNRALIVAGTFQEITMQKNMHEKLYQYAHIDLLAEVPNRRSFNECLESLHHRYVGPDTQHVLFYLDLNKFKEVNDRYGHEAGDKVIKNVGQRLKTLIRSSDHVFRVGGDEFVLLLENVESLAVIEVIAEKVVKGLSEPHQLANGSVVVTPPSIGVAVYPNDGNNPDTLICHADQMMYLAKRRYPTGGYEVYTPEKFVLSTENSQPRYC